MSRINHRRRCTDTKPACEELVQTWRRCPSAAMWGNLSVSARENAHFFYSEFASAEEESAECL